MIEMVKSVCTFFLLPKIIIHYQPTVRFNTNTTEVTVASFNKKKSAAANFKPANRRLAAAKKQCSAIQWFDVSFLFGGNFGHPSISEPLLLLLDFSTSCWFTLPLDHMSGTQKEHKTYTIMVELEKCSCQQLCVQRAREWYH